LHAGSSADNYIVLHGLWRCVVESVDTQYS
jgi:hypothetical protein